MLGEYLQGTPLEQEITKLGQRGDHRLMKVLIDAVEKNTRAVKRFINEVQMANRIFFDSIEKIGELIAVQALISRREWTSFFEHISSNNSSGKEILSAFANSDRNEINRVLGSAKDFYPDLGNDDDKLTKFLIDGGASLLYSINDFEKYRRALDHVSILQNARILAPSAIPEGAFVIGSQVKETSQGNYKFGFWINAAQQEYLFQISKVTYQTMNQLKSVNHADNKFETSFNFPFNPSTNPSFYIRAWLKFKDGEEKMLSQTITVPKQ